MVTGEPALDHVQSLPLKCGILQGVNSIDKLKFQLSFQLTFQLSFASTVGHPVVLAKLN